MPTFWRVPLPPLFQESRTTFSGADSGIVLWEWPKQSIDPSQVCTGYNQRQHHHHTYTSFLAAVGSTALGWCTFHFEVHLCDLGAVTWFAPMESWHFCHIQKGHRDHGKKYLQIFELKPFFSLPLSVYSAGFSANTVISDWSKVLWSRDYCLAEGTGDFGAATAVDSYYYHKQESRSGHKRGVLFC